MQTVSNVVALAQLQIIENVFDGSDQYFSLDISGLVYIVSFKSISCIVGLLLCFHYGFIMGTYDKFLNTSTLCFCVTFCSSVCNDQTQERITRERNISCFYFISR